ncbi:hypothetical protein [Aquabacterium sp.]|jgi:hypothetical protein|uniref:hypothetical protein n=1 Tax=Aquabacterium sp. TaxID=1872578 RepID=UPI0025BCAF6D|nr:hypothetical protein [Aquabacterium sp.]
MKIEALFGKLEDGAMVPVFRVSALNELEQICLDGPHYQLSDGERLAPLDESMKYFFCASSGKLLSLLWNWPN